MTSEPERFSWWRAWAEAGDGDAMVEVAERLGRGAGVARDAAAALDWYGKAVRAGVPRAAAFVGEQVFEADPIAGIVWLLLAFERAPMGDEANAAMAATLTQLEPRLSDEAVQAAQVWADACRERDAWPDEVPTPHAVRAPFRARPPTPPLPTRTGRTMPMLTQAVTFGPWRVLLPPAARLETLHAGQHLRATWGGAYTQHLVWATLAPGLDIDGYVRRGLSASGRLWVAEAPPARFLLHGLDTTSCVFTGQGVSAGQRALKRFVSFEDQVAVLTSVAAVDAFEKKRTSLEAVADSAHHLALPRPPAG